MKLHDHIIHHVRKHTRNIVAHVHKHHKKYIAGAGILSGMAIFKLIGIVAIFFGATYMGGGTLGGDYYDAEYYLQEKTKEISISGNTSIGCDVNITGENLSGGTNFSGTTGNCPSITK